MTYVLRKDGSQDSTEAFVASWRKYKEQLAAISDRLPPSARDSRSRSGITTTKIIAPRDAWVESLTINETSSGPHQENRQVHIKLRLLGAYHDGHIEIEYLNVKRYPSDVSIPPTATGIKMKSDYPKLETSYTK